MSTNTLTNFFISDTYTGLLHSKGAPLPDSGQSIIYDGLGVASAISLGQLNSGAGVSINGTLTINGHTDADTLHCTAFDINNISYPAVAGATGNVLYQANANTISTAPATTLLPNVISPGDYDHSTGFTVTTQGLITSVRRPYTNDGTIVSVTKYFAGEHSIGNFTLSKDIWTKIPITNDDYKNALAGIFFMGPRDDTQGGIAESLEQYFVSPDSTHNRTYRIMAIIHPREEDGMGVQFQCPLGGTVGTNDRYLYIRKVNQQEKYGEGTDYLGQLKGIAAQF